MIFLRLYVFINNMLTMGVSKIVITRALTSLKGTYTLLECEKKIILVCTYLYVSKYIGW